MFKLFVLACFIIFTQVYASCDRKLPPFSYRHKAKIITISGKSNLSITIKNSSRMAIEMRPIILINGLQFFQTLKFEKIECDAVKRYNLPVNTVSSDIIHVFYQKNPTLSESDLKIIVSLLKNEFQIISEALIGVDLDVIYNKNVKSITKNIGSIKKIQTLNYFNGSRFIGKNNINKIETYLSSVSNSISLKLQFGIGNSKPGKYFLSCFLNGKQIKVFQNKEIGQVDIKSNTSIITEVNILGLKKGINHIKCYSVNGLNSPNYFGNENLNPNDINSIYISHS